MKEIKQLQILSATEAREINPWGRKPNHNQERYSKWTFDGTDWEHYNSDLNRWQAAESSLKTYRIVKPSLMPVFNSGRNAVLLGSNGNQYSEHQEVSCECNEQELTAIIL